MELGGYFASVGVEYEGHKGQVVGGETNKDSKTGAWVPFWDFIPILQNRVKNVYGAAEDMSPSQFV